MTAATMVSSAAAVVTRGGAELLYLGALMLVLAGSAVIYHRRYRGIAPGGSAVQAWPQG